MAQTSANAPAPQKSAPAADDFLKAYNAKAFPEARRILEAILARRPDWTDAQISYAQLIHEKFGETAQATKVLETVLSQQPDSLKALKLLMAIHGESGRIDLAASCADRLVAISPAAPEPYLTLFRARPESGAALAERIERAMRDHDLDDRDRSLFHTILGQIADRAGDVDRAFGQFTTANRLKPNRYDPRRMEICFANMARVFTGEMLRDRQRLGVADPSPVFVIGLPRSGATHLEELLSRHPGIESAGERDEFPSLFDEMRERVGAPPPGNHGGGEFFAKLPKADTRAAANRYLTQIRATLSDPKTPRWVDKMPANFILAGAIQTLLPSAHLIHAHRDPLDVALSCYMHNFQDGHNFTRDLRSLAHYMATQRRFMTHWRKASPAPILDMRYEEAVADPAGQARLAVEHVGLEWRAAHLAPAPAAEDRITPLRKTTPDAAIGCWRRYERHLAPLLDAWRDMGASVLDEIMSDCVDPLKL